MTGPTHPLTARYDLELHFRPDLFGHNEGRFGESPQTSAIGDLFLYTPVEVVVATSEWTSAHAAIVGPLGTLTDGQREILWLRVVLGLSAEETAAALDTTPELVRVTQHRALNRLRRALGG